MNKVISTYKISHRTLALIPGRSIDYEAIVITVDETKYVRQTPFDLIKKVCSENDWTTYEGRRQSVIQHTNFIQKTPIPVDICKGIYFLPTHSPSHIDNVWIAFHQILSIKKVPQRERTKHAQSIVYFKNGLALELSVSYHTLEEQYNRTLHCITLRNKENRI